MNMFIKLLIIIPVYMVVGLVFLKPVYIEKSNDYLDKTFSHISEIEKKSFILKISDCQTVYSNRYSMNILNLFNNKNDIEYVKSSLSKCFEQYVIKSSDNVEMKFRKKQVSHIIDLN